MRGLTARHSTDGAPGGEEQAGALPHFLKLAEFIHRVAGIKLPPSKQSMVEGRLRRRIAATGAKNFAQYCAQVLKDGETGKEIVNLIDAITTNKTDFFREPQHFRLLTETVLPAMDTARAPIKLWSAACSIGAEPYTLAMVMSEYMAAQRARNLPMPAPVIIATDLSTAVLHTAWQGIFSEEMVAPVPPELRKRYLLRSKNPNERTVRIVPQLRAMVRFGRLNFMSDDYGLDHDLDIIFCRNVLIYFDRADQLAVLTKLCGHLRPGGVLAVGHSESLHNFKLPLTPIGQTMFRKNP
jgi:chemotaxis protein methyltransferase CheR